MECDYNHIENEIKVYKKMKYFEGFPNLLWKGNAGDYNVLILDLLGQNLEQLFNQFNRRFTLRTVLMIAD